MTSRNDRIAGCLLGGAVGDALGAPVEFWSSARIARDLPDGVRDYLPSDYGAERGLITDDTQMTLFTLEALLRCIDDATAHPMAELHRSYLQWWDTQSMATPPADAAPGSLRSQSWLYSRRAPGLTCSGALIASRDRLGVPASNDSKGCGAVMRSAPFGLLPRDDGPSLAMAGASLTHGHPTAQVSAGALAVLIDRLMHDIALPDAVAEALEWARAQPGGEETADALTVAVSLASSGQEPGQATVERMGGAWVGEEALAIAVYCSLAYPEPPRIGDALSLAVCHGGDSDSTGAICGNILGALHGQRHLPSHLVNAVEGLVTIRAVAARSCAVMGERSLLEADLASSRM